MPALAHSARRTPRFSPAGIGVVVFAHLIIGYGLLRMNVIRLPEPLAVLSVSLLPPAPPQVVPEPKVVPPKPMPVARRPDPLPETRPAPLAAPADAPAPTAATVPPPPPQAARPAAIAEPAAPPAPSQPRFDADYLDNPKPRYPPLSRKLGEQGRVVLWVHVGADGLPLEVRIHAGSGHARLDGEALATVRRWKFSPARLGGQAVAASVTVPIDFSLKD